MLRTSPIVKQVTSKKICLSFEEEHPRTSLEMNFRTEPRLALLFQGNLDDPLNIHSSPSIDAIASSISYKTRSSSIVASFKMKEI
jgi:hypothetical protein